MSIFCFSIAVSLSIITNAIGSLLWASYSSYCKPHPRWILFHVSDLHWIDGRKPVYLLTLSIECLGSLGVASAKSVPTLLTWRVIQAFGSSSGLSVGMGVIGDIYKIEQRGTASGVFFAVGLVERHHYNESLTGKLC